MFLKLCDLPGDTGKPNQSKFVLFWGVAMEMRAESAEGRALERALSPVWGSGGYASGKLFEV